MSEHSFFIRGITFGTLIPIFAAENERLKQQHASELQEKEREIAELKKSLGEIDKLLRTLQGTHYKTKSSLDATTKHLRELEASEKDWREFLARMDSELSGKFFGISFYCHLRHVSS